MKDFVDNLIAKWEKSTGLKALGHIELGKGKEIPYWDHKFVQNLLDYAKTLYGRSEDLKGKFEAILKEFDDEKTTS